MRDRQGLSTGDSVFYSPLLRGRTTLMKIGAKNVAAILAPLKYRVNVNSLEQLAAEKLELKFTMATT
jgi:sulfate adenylyltransferase subunit 1 (EFTu-like GTPase family)